MAIYGEVKFHANNPFQPCSLAHMIPPRLSKLHNQFGELAAEISQAKTLTLIALDSPFELNPMRELCGVFPERTGKFCCKPNLCSL
jgi:hypothetical protein